MKEEEEREQLLCVLDDDDGEEDAISRANKSHFFLCFWHAKTRFLRLL